MRGEDRGEDNARLHSFQAPALARYQSPIYSTATVGIGARTFALLPPGGFPALFPGRSSSAAVLTVLAAALIFFTCSFRSVAALFPASVGAYTTEGSAGVVGRTGGSDV